MFPTGTAGAALFVLRISVGASLVVDGAGNPSMLTLFWMVLGFAVPAILCLGFLTPYCAALCCLLQLRVLLVQGGQNEFHLVLSILNSGVLAVLGPGAYSIDARIFGRQLLTVPPGK